MDVLSIAAPICTLWSTSRHIDVVEAIHLHSETWPAAYLLLVSQHLSSGSHVLHWQCLLKQLGQVVLCDDGNGSYMRIPLYSMLNCSQRIQFLSLLCEHIDMVDTNALYGFISTLDSFAHLLNQWEAFLLKKLTKCVVLMEPHRTTEDIEIAKQEVDECEEKPKEYYFYPDLVDTCQKLVNQWTKKKERILLTDDDLTTLLKQEPDLIFDMFRKLGLPKPNDSLAQEVLAWCVMLKDSFLYSPVPKRLLSELVTPVILASKQISSVIKDLSVIMIQKSRLLFLQQILVPMVTCQVFGAAHLTFLKQVCLKCMNADDYNAIITELFTKHSLFSIFHSEAQLEYMTICIEGMAADNFPIAKFVDSLKLIAKEKQKCPKYAKLIIAILQKFGEKLVVVSDAMEYIVNQNGTFLSKKMNTLYANLNFS